MLSKRGNRVPKMELIERIIFKGRSCFTTTDDEKVTKLVKHVTELDREWFGNMPNSFFVEKYKEEMGELREAHNNYVSYKYINRDKGYREALRYAFISELSDVILAASSALFENMINEKNVLNDISSLISELDETAAGFNNALRISDLCIVDLLEAHSSKMEEMIFAKNTYTKILWDEYTPWRNMMLKLHTIEELTDPRNKMYIVKEIRRMWFALKEFSIMH